MEYAWQKGIKPKRGEFSPDFFIKPGESIYVTEIKEDEEIADPSPENVKKHEYPHVYLPVASLVSPEDFGKYFTKLKDRQLDGFRSDLDRKILEVETTV